MGTNISVFLAPTRLKESFLTHISEHLTINFVTFVDDNQRTDYSVTRNKRVYSKCGSVKMGQRKNEQYTFLEEK